MKRPTARARAAANGQVFKGLGVTLYSAENLGCPGFALGKWFYIDVFSFTSGLRGVFVNCNGRKYWFTRSGIRRES